jgi:hypothetical protein
MKLNYRRFPDWSEFLDFVMPDPDIKNHKSKLTARNYTWLDRQSEFFECETFEDAKQLMAQGWIAGAAKVMQLRAGLDSLVRSASVARASSMGWGAAGEWLHIGRAIQGRPDCFARSVDCGFDTADRVITVAMNASCSGTASSQDLFARGAVALCLVDVLETLGHRVELLFGTSSQRMMKCGHYTHDEFTAVAKKPGEHLDIDRLAFLFCHKDGVRRIAYRVYEHNGRYCDGSPREMHQTKQSYPGCIVVPEITYPINTNEIVMACLAEAGVAIDVDALVS